MRGAGVGWGERSVVEGQLLLELDRGVVALFDRALDSLQVPS